MDEKLLGTRPYQYIVMHHDGKPVCYLDTKEEAIKAAAGLATGTEGRLIVYAPIAFIEGDFLAALDENGTVGMIVEND